MASSIAPGDSLTNVRSTACKPSARIKVNTLNLVGDAPVTLDGTTLTLQNGLAIHAPAPVQRRSWFNGTGVLQFENEGIIHASGENLQTPGNTHVIDVPVRANSLYRVC